MKTHEGKMGRRSPKRARLVAAATALVSALALAAPSIAGATLYPSRTSTSTSTSSTSTSPISLTISQNTAMIVVVAPTTDTSATGAVSWSDVSWSDSSLVD